ncbi:MAG: hypothetical protein LUB61_01420 [Eggerthellaceae bacterium]|nr:hypothetical protein [Eggerthellaceae bacterium]
MNEEKKKFNLQIPRNFVRSDIEYWDVVSKKYRPYYIVTLPGGSFFGTLDISHYQFSPPRIMEPDYTDDFIEIPMEYGGTVILYPSLLTPDGKPLLYTPGADCKNNAIELHSEDVKEALEYSQRQYSGHPDDQPLDERAKDAIRASEVLSQMHISMPFFN